jgi:hypothetical protein
MSRLRSRARIVAVRVARDGAAPACEGGMIIRRLASVQQLITQPAHAALAARIIGHWDRSRFPDSPRKASILRATEQHDSGWAGVDDSLILDETTGRLLDFMEVSDAVKRETAARGIEELASDPYAAALVAQHRLHVYRRFLEHPEWNVFFAAMKSARDSYLRAAGAGSLGDLLRDYAFVRAGDLASLAFCNNWKETADDGCGYAMRLEGTTLLLSPDPFGGRTIEIEIEAREVDDRSFASAADARRTFATARTVAVKGVVGGANAAASCRYGVDKEAGQDAARP